MVSLHEAGFREKPSDPTVPRSIRGPIVPTTTAIGRYSQSTSIVKLVPAARFEL